MTSEVLQEPLEATAVIARFAAGVSHDAIPLHVRARAVNAIADGLGVIIAGSRESAGLEIRNYVIGMGGRAESSLLPGGQMAPAEMAALVNGTAGHSLEFDDISHPAHAHPTAVLLPALLAVGEKVSSSGRELVTAYVVGFEVEAALGRGLNLDHYRAGWHATSTLGAIGAAVAVAKLLGCGAEEMEMAIGVAASSACGVRGNFGSMTKPLHAGLAAAAGVRAAALAAAGWTGTRGIIEVKSGFAEAFIGGGTPDFRAMVEGLGSRWTLLEPTGLAIKLYPSCGGTHPALDAAFAVRGDIGSKPIRSVHIGRPRLAFDVANYPNPQTKEQACFSLEYVVAAALVRGHLRLDDMVPPALDEPQVRELMSRTTQAIAPEISDSREYGAVLKVELEDGTTLTHRAEVARGKNADPLTDEELRTKFEGCVGEGSRSLWRAINDVDGEGSLKPILKLLKQLPISTGRHSAIRDP